MMEADELLNVPVIGGLVKVSGGGGHVYRPRLGACV